MSTFGDKSDAPQADTPNACANPKKDADVNDPDDESKPITAAAAATETHPPTKPQANSEPQQQVKNGSPPLPQGPPVGVSQFQHGAMVPLPPTLQHVQRASTTETIFPVKLYEILCNPEFAHAIRWMPHGRSWKVFNREYFMEEICPHYFSQTRFESFIRQVNGWGFKRLRREGPDRSSYYHPNFLRGHPRMIEQMRRPMSGEKARDDSEEPDLFALPPLPQLPPRPAPVAVMIDTKTKAGRPSHSKVGSRSSFFDTVPPRGDFPPGPYNPFMAPWGPGPPPPYFIPPPNAHRHPLNSPIPAGPPPHGYPYPPGTPFPHPPMCYPYFPAFDPTYCAYPPHPSTPQGRSRGDSSIKTPNSKRDREESRDDDNENSPKRPQPSPYEYRPPPPMGYYCPPMLWMAPKNEENSFGNGSAVSAGGNGD